MYLAGNDSIYFKTHVIRKTLTSKARGFIFGGEGCSIISRLWMSMKELYLLSVLKCLHSTLSTVFH